MNVVETVIYLASCAVNGTKPETDKISRINFEEIFSLASYHVMSAVVAMAFESAGVKNDQVKNAISFSVRKNTFFEASNNSVLKSLEEAGIWHMPLKGAVLKNYYPRFGMREMSDHDILIDATRAEDVKSIIESRSIMRLACGVNSVFGKQSQRTLSRQKSSRKSQVKNCSVNNRALFLQGVLNRASCFHFLEV